MPARTCNGWNRLQQCIPGDGPQHPLLKRGQHPACSAPAKVRSSSSVSTSRHKLAGPSSRIRSAMTSPRSQAGRCGRSKARVQPSAAACGSRLPMPLPPPSPVRRLGATRPRSAALAWRHRAVAASVMQPAPWRTAGGPDAASRPRRPGHDTPELCNRRLDVRHASWQTNNRRTWHQAKCQTNGRAT